MLVVVLIDTVVLNPVFKSLWFSVLFGVFYVHDRDRMPFKHQVLNNLQRLTSASLFVINICSTPSAFSSVGNITAVPHMDICLKFLRYFELCLYGVVALSLPLALIYPRLKYGRNQTND